MSVPDTIQAVLLTGHGGLDKLETVENCPVPMVADIAGCVTLIPDRFYTELNINGYK